MTGARVPRNLACGHPVWPGAQFCPACGRPTAYRRPVPPAAPAPPSGPSTAPLPSLPPLPDASTLSSWYAPPLPPPPPPSGPPVDLPPPAGPYATRIEDPYPTRQGDLRPWPPSAGWPPPGWPRRSRRKLIPLIAAAALVAAVAGVVVSRGHPAQNAASGGAPARAATRSGAQKASPRDAAARLSALLGHSVTDRGAVTSAVVDARACGPSLQRDGRTFARAARARDGLVSSLRRMPGRSALSAAMLRDLAGAWQASARADTDLARWADDKIASGCHSSRASGRLQASYGPDGQASADKKAFAGLWDPIARRYGLTAYQWDQL